MLKKTGENLVILLRREKFVFNDERSRIIVLTISLMEEKYFPCIRKIANMQNVWKKV